jgi:hypothetical protein
MGRWAGGGIGTKERIASEWRLPRRIKTFLSISFSSIIHNPTSQTKSQKKTTCLARLVLQRRLQTLAGSTSLTNPHFPHHPHSGSTPLNSPHSTHH